MMLDTSSLAIVVALASCAGQETRAPNQASSSPTKKESPPATIQLPGGEAGIGLDDLRYSSRLGRVLVPGGRTGNLDLVDPATGTVTTIGGFGVNADYAGGHGDGTTSVDEGAGLLFAIDRTSKELVVVDPIERVIVSRAPLAASPDYVRYVGITSELWVTEPDAEAIEIFRLPAGKNAAPEHSSVIAVKGGPESLVIDAKRGLAYTHLWKGTTVVIDLRLHSIKASWENGCTGSRGIALDEQRGFLFVGCAEGLAVVLDVDHDGKQLSTAPTGAGVDIIDYDAQRGHLYVPGGKSASLTILGVSAKGELSVLGTLAAASGSHCVTTDGNGHVFVGDPEHGRLLVLADTFPASGH